MFLIKCLMIINLLIIIVIIKEHKCLLFKRFQGKRIEHLIYRQYETTTNVNISYCIRRFNLTHNVGCSSSKNGNNGHPYLVTQDLSMNLLRKKFEKYGPLILLISVYDFHSLQSLRIERFQFNQYVAGVILIDNQSPINSFNDEYKSYSQDSRCPNTDYGGIIKDSINYCSPNISIPNPYENYSKISWPFPIFFVKDQLVIEELIQCKQQQNCQIELQSFMYGTINSKRCLQRSRTMMDMMMVESSYCKLIRARNLLTTLYSIMENQTYDNDNRSILVLTARLDSFTIFDSYSPGFDSVYSAIIVIILIIDTLNHNRQLLTKTNELKNVLYALFDGESFGHIGSNSWIFYNNFIDDNNYGSLLSSKIRLKSIKYVIELNQLIGKEYWIHSNSSSSLLADKFLKFCNRNNFHHNIMNTLPQTSTAKLFQLYDQHIDAILLSTYGSTIENPYYHSLFDNGQNYDRNFVIKRLYNVANLMVNFLIELLTNENHNVKCNEKLAENLVDCFTIMKSNCSLFNSKLNLSNVPFEFTSPIQRETELMINTIEAAGSSLPKRIQMNINVKRSIQMIMIYANGQRINCSTNNKINGFTIINNDNNECIIGQTIMEISESIYAEYLGKGLLLLQNDINSIKNRIQKLWSDNGIQFSTWTESNYQKNRPVIRIYLKQHESLWIQFVSIICGVIITIITIYTIKQIQFLNFEQLN